MATWLATQQRGDVHSKQLEKTGSGRRKEGCRGRDRKGFFLLQSLNYFLVAFRENLLE